VIFVKENMTKKSNNVFKSSEMKNFIDNVGIKTDFLNTK
jgi:hypothetical protein